MSAGKSSALNTELRPSVIATFAITQYDGTTGDSALAARSAVIRTRAGVSSVASTVNDEPDIAKRKSNAPTTVSDRTLPVAVNTVSPIVETWTARPIAAPSSHAIDAAANASNGSKSSADSPSGNISGSHANASASTPTLRNCSTG